MSKIMQQKFEIREEQNRNDDASSGWVSDSSARVKKGLPGPGGRFAQEGDASTSMNAVFYNGLPQGMDGDDQENADRRVQPYGGSMGTGSQVTNDVTKESLRQGFDRKSLRPTDDMYTREHNDSFYDEATVDGVTGFLERNNYLDRE